MKVYLLSFLLICHPVWGLIVPSQEMPASNDKCVHGGGSSQYMTQEESEHRMAIVFAIIWGLVGLGVGLKTDEGEDPDIWRGILYGTGAGFLGYIITKSGGSPLLL